MLRGRGLGCQLPDLESSVTYTNHNLFVLARVSFLMLLSVIFFFAQGQGEEEELCGFLDIGPLLSFSFRCRPL